MSCLMELNLYSFQLQYCKTYRYVGLYRSISVGYTANDKIVYTCLLGQLLIPVIH